MKKLILMLLLVVGGVNVASAWTQLYLKCDGHWDSNDEGYEFTKLDVAGNEWSIILDGSVINNGPFYFRFWVKDLQENNGNEICSANTDNGLDQEVSENFVTSNYERNNDHSPKAFKVAQDTEAEKLQIYICYYQENDKWIWHIAACPLKEYTIGFVNSGNYERVNFYSYVSNNFYKFTGNWPGETITEDNGIYKKTFFASTNNAKIIFNNNSGTQTESFDIVDNAIYDNTGKVDSKNVSVGPLGYATFSCAYPLDFANVSGLKAYTVTSTGTGNGIVKLAQVTGKVPAATGLLLKSEGTASASVDVPTAIWTVNVENMLKASVSEVSLQGNCKAPYRYILAGTDAASVGFYYVNENRTSAAGKAYLESNDDLNPDPANGARVSWVFEDQETTGINNVKSANLENEVYNLNGQRVNNAVRGLYIVNGKKVIMK